MTRFTPHKAQKQVTVTITSLEAVLIQKLRRYAYGKFTVNKVDGLITHLEINNREKIDEMDDINL